MAKTKITLTAVQALESGAALWDTEVRGFGVRRQRRDTVYVLKCRIQGRQRQFTIGKHGAPWTPVTARKEAQRLLGEVAAGRGAETVRAREAEATTVAEFADRYLDEYAVAQKKESSVRTDRSNIANHIKPALATMLISEVAVDHINALLNSIATGKVTKPPKSGRSRYRGGAIVTGGQGVANRCRALLSKMFNLAERWGVRPQHSNPVRHSVRFREKAVERYLTEVETSQLLEILDKAEAEGAETIHLLNAIRLLLLTGARLGEVQGLKWEYVDPTRGIAMLPDSKTGRKALVLSDETLKVLENTPRLEGNPYVFAGSKEGKPIVNFRKPWDRIRKAAGIDGVRLHDLRHNFASEAINSGTPLATIGALLGHKHVKTTQRYAHLAEKTLREAGNATANKIMQRKTK